MTVFCSDWNDSFVVFSNRVLVSLFQFSCSIKDKLCGKTVIQEHIVYCLGRELSFPRKRKSRGVLTLREYYVFILTKINSISVSKIFSPNNVLNKQKQITTTN